MDWQKYWSTSRPTIVSAIIAVAVIAGLFILFNTLPANQENQEEEQNQEEQSNNDNNNNDKNGNGEDETKLPAKYTVKRGDSLWKISTRFYGTGYNWVAIASANKLANPDIIHSGTTLTIPKADVRPKTYTVVRGDSLWSIAQRYYGSGYQWVKIKDANAGKVGKLPNGRPLITPGQVLRIP